MPRRDLPIVHIVTEGAIRKLVLKKGIVGDPRPAAASNHVGATRRRADGFFIGNRSVPIGILEEMSPSRDGREAGGNAMRRPPEVVQVGLLLVTLLGASGCSGFPQRSNGTSLWGAPSDGEPAPPPGVFSWLHRKTPQTGASATDGAGLAGVSGSNTAPVVANPPETDPWPETQSQWFARNFPRLTRLWNGSTTGRPADGGELTVRLQTSRTPATSPAADAAGDGLDPRADQDVRPTDGATQDAAAASAGRDWLTSPVSRRSAVLADIHRPTSRRLARVRPEPASDPAVDVTTPVSASGGLEAT